jgi:hypothetical protein
MPRKDGLYYTLVWYNLGRQFVPTEDELYFFIDCMYPIRDIVDPYLGKTGRTTS